MIVVGLISGSTAWTSQLSVTVFPLLTPPCTTRPFRARAVTVSCTPL